MRHENYANSHLVEVWDSDAGEYSRFDDTGEVAEVRPLTAAELARLTPPPPPPLSSEQKLDVVKAKLAELEALAAPVLAADVADILAEIEGAI